MKPWKRPYTVDFEGDVGLLQWGHGDEAVEEIVPAAHQTPETELQWGHGDEAVEEWRNGAKCVELPPASMGPRR